MTGTYGVTSTTDSGLNQLVAGRVHEMKDVVLASGAGVLARGTVISQLDATYEWKQLTPGASNGSETARAILAEDADASASAVKAGAYFVGKYRADDLIWPAGITNAQKRTAIRQLQDRGVIIDETMTAAVAATTTTTTTT